MVLNHTCRQLSRDILLAVNYPRTCELQSGVRDVVTRLQLHRRGCRAGNHNLRRLVAIQTASLSVGRAVRSGEIPTVTGNRQVVYNQLFHGRRCERSSVIERIHIRGPWDNMRLGLFNACSVSNKSASIQQWIVEKKLRVLI
jgi:hypothetical protein